MGSRGSVVVPGITDAYIALAGQQGQDTTGFTEATACGQWEMAGLAQGVPFTWAEPPAGRLNDVCAQYCCSQGVPPAPRAHLTINYFGNADASCTGPFTTDFRADFRTLANDECLGSSENIGESASIYGGYCDFGTTPPRFVGDYVTGSATCTSSEGVYFEQFSLRADGAACETVDTSAAGGTMGSSVALRVQVTCAPPPP